MIIRDLFGKEWEVDNQDKVDEYKRLFLNKMRIFADVIDCTDDNVIPMHDDTGENLDVFDCFKAFAYGLAATDGNPVLKGWIDDILLKGRWDENGRLEERYIWANIDEAIRAMK